MYLCKLIVKIHKFFYMSTYRELTYQILDELKMVSDDSHFTEEHIIFLLDKFRTFLLKQRYSDIRKEIPESNYQTVCLDLEPIKETNSCIGNTYLKSKQQIPYMMSIGSRKISTLDYFQGNINYTNSERFKYVGHNKYLKNQAYATIAPDNYLYLKSNNPKLYYLEQIKVTGIFEDSTKVAILQEGCTEFCDIMDMKFPLEESLIPPLTELIIKELSAARYQPEDSTNNASDDLSNLASYMKSELAKGKYSNLYKNI